MPNSPDRFDFAAKSPDDFEEMVHSLVVDEWPEARKLARPDGGADSLLPSETADGSYERAWQAKRFDRQIKWPQCVASLKRVIETWSVSHVTFVFARDLTMGQQKLFDQKLVAYDRSVRVDWWGAAELTDRLRREPGGVRVAKHHFKIETFDDLQRALRAQGPLQTGNDVADRIFAVSGFVNEADPRYRYNLRSESAEEPTGPPPANVPIRLEIEQDGHRLGVDAVARHPDVYETQPLSGSLRAEGADAAQRLSEVLRDGGTIDAGAGISVEMEGLPKLMQDIWASRDPTTMQLTVVKFSWPGRLIASGVDGAHVIDIDFRAVGDTPDDSRVLTGTCGGLSVTLTLTKDWVGDRGTLGLDWSYRLTTGPVNDELKVLAYLRALRRAGTVTLRDRAAKVQDLVMPLTDLPPDPYLDDLWGFLSAVKIIEDHAQVTLTRPATIEGPDLYAVASAAALIQRGGTEMPISSAKATGNHIGLTAFCEPGTAVARYPVEPEIFGQPVRVGDLVLSSPPMREVSRTPVSGEPGIFDAVFEPSETPVWAELQSGAANG